MAAELMRLLYAKTRKPMSKSSTVRSRAEQKAINTYMAVVCLSYTKLRSRDSTFSPRVPLVLKSLSSLLRQDRNLVLGISGGLVPCSSALVLLLSTIALGRIGFGLKIL